MELAGPFPYGGEVIWLTPDQGGRPSGVPDLPHLAAAGFVPPHTLFTGLASFALRGWDPGSWRSDAEGRWLLVEAEAAQRVEPGSLVVVTEGPRTIALFTIHDIRPD